MWYCCLLLHTTSTTALKTTTAAPHRCPPYYQRHGAAAEQVNTTLTHLELSGNVIDYDGITALAEALTENQALHSLHIK